MAIRIGECGVERHDMGDFEVDMCSAIVRWVFGKRSRVPVPVDILWQRNVSINPIPQMAEAVLTRRGSSEFRPQLNSNPGCAEPGVSDHTSVGSSPKDQRATSF